MKLLSTLAVAGLFALPPAAFAQENGDAFYDGKSWLPFTTNGYIGAGVGQSKFPGSSCVPLLTCDQHDTALKAYIGGRVYNIVGIELSYLDFGRIDRNGGSARANVANASLILNAPLGRYVGVFARGGGGYAWTRTRSDLPGVDTGNRHNFDWGYGAGVNVNLNRHWTLRGEWERQQVHFTTGREDLDMWTAGANYKF